MKRSLVVITDEILSSKSIEVLPNESKYIYIMGHISKCLISIDITDSLTDTCVIQASIVDPTLFTLAESHSDITWENIVISGVEYSQVTFSFSSIEINAPNYIYIHNEESSDHSITLHIRGAK